MKTFEEQFPSLAKVKCRTFTDKCLMKTCLDKQKVKDEVVAIIEKVEPVIVPDGTNLQSAGMKIACAILNDKLNLGIDMNKYPNCFLCETNDLINKNKVKETIEKINPFTQDEFTRGCLTTKRRILRELGLMEE